jgi:hypothetical protein
MSLGKIDHQQENATMKALFATAALLLLAAPANAQIKQIFQCQGQEKIWIACAVQDGKYMTILTTNGTDNPKKCSYICSLGAVGGSKTGYNGTATFPVGQTQLLFGRRPLDKALASDAKMTGTCWCDYK